jgi:hypothetical protein
LDRKGYAARAFDRALAFNFISPVTPVLDLIQPRSPGAVAAPPGLRDDALAVVLRVLDILDVMDFLDVIGAVEAIEAHEIAVIA